MVWWPNAVVTKGCDNKGNMVTKEMGRRREAGVTTGVWRMEAVTKGREYDVLGKRRRRECGMLQRVVVRREAVPKGVRWSREAATKGISWFWEVVTQPADLGKWWRRKYDNKGSLWKPRIATTKGIWWSGEAIMKGMRWRWICGDLGIIGIES